MLAVAKKLVKWALIVLLVLFVERAAVWVPTRYVKKVAEYAETSWAESMRAAAGEHAVKYARDLDECAQSRFSAQTPREKSIRALALALELNGEYSDALQFHKKLTLLPEIKSYTRGIQLHRDMLLARGRIAYRRKEYARAFGQYCSFLNLMLEEDEGAMGDLHVWYISSRRWEAAVRICVTNELDAMTVCLSPFFEFSDFTRFMEREYKKLGSPEEFADEMEVIRAINALKDELDRGVWKEEAPMLGRDWGVLRRDSELLRERRERILKKRAEQKRPESAADGATRANADGV